MGINILGGDTTGSKKDLIINIVVANLLLGGRIHPEASRYDVGQSSVDDSRGAVTDALARNHARYRGFEDRLQGRP